jgi:hypothetical protein
MELGDSDTRSLLSQDAGTAAPDRRRSTERASNTSSNSITASYTLMDTPVATAVLEPFQLQSHAVTMAESSIVYATPVLSFCESYYLTAMSLIASFKLAQQTPAYEHL